MNHLFVSYSRADQQWVLELANALQARGVEVWLDQRSLPVSLPWLTEVRDAIDEASIVVYCDSARFRSSSPCASEAELAGNAGKLTVTVKVDDDIEKSTNEVLAALRRIPLSALAATELRVRARNWDRAGRPRGALVGWRDQRRLGNATHGLIETDIGDGRSFLRTSRRRSRRRGAFAVLVGLAYFVGRGADRILPELTEHATGIDKGFAERTSLAAEVAEVSKTNSYEAMRRALDMGAPESELSTIALRAALVRPVPDDAFSIDGTPVEFLGGPIEGSVRVIDQEHRTWTRNAESPEERLGKRWEGSATASVTTDGLRAVTLPDSGAVEIFDGDQLIRRIFVPSGPLTLAEVSPSQQLAIVTSGIDVHVLNLSSGSIVRTLSGAGGEVRDLRWASDSERVWAIAGERVVSWQITKAEMVTLVPDAWISAIVPSGDGNAWLVHRDGKLRLVDLATGKELRTSDIGARALAVTTAKESFFVASDAANYVVDLGTGQATPVEGLDCDSAVGSGAATADGNSVAVPCEDGSVLLIDLRSSRAIQTFDVPRASVVAIDDDRMLVGSSDGIVYEVVMATGAVTQLEGAWGCRARFVTMAADGDTAVVAGVGAGHLSCTLSTSRDGTWVPWLVYFADPGMARSSLVIGGGSVVVLGMDDGRISFFPARNFSAVQFELVSGGIRDMVFDEVSSTLFVVTRNGEVARVSVELDAISEDWMAVEAERRLTRATELGLVAASAG